jgi:putative membrane-bound dehydrogenase-like protein
MNRTLQALGCLTVAALAASGAQAADAKPLFASKIVTVQTPGKAVDIDVDLSGAKELYLVVTDGGDGFGADWADWAEPRIVTDGGEKKLTDLKWKSAQAGWGQIGVNKNVQGQPLKIDGKPVEYGLGTHAPSMIVYELPADAKRFKARAGLDNGGSDQGTGSSVAFMVFGSKPPASVLAISSGTGPIAAVGHDPADAVAGLDVAAGLQAQLFASEPMITNPTNIDIDSKGRIWLADVKNYRGHNNSRPEGDRILILEDTTGSGKADKVTVFYQGRDIDSAHGVCVLETPDGKNTKVIVSAGDKVQVFVDKDGDGKSDEKYTLFSGISGTQHDHGIHQFMFGPDGKLYFNFGNAGGQLKDKDGKPIIDKAGNEINSSRKPYSQGMVFRCNVDGSELETLGWNFRNNWMVTVDSFGTLWQSDNDDDGNRGVRINYVMEYGNYGYTDEITGAGWGDKRTNIEKEIPLRHWHLNDPGVVPNLLQTGQGAPTGICIYEADLLPKIFQNQMLHCDPGPNVCRAYPVKKDGAGYTAEIVPILTGTRDKWFRPDDVKVAPDGSIFISDWYDPGVGGHAQGETNMGRVFRVAPTGSFAYKVPKYDFTTIDGCVAALKSPTPSVRAVAWTALHEQGAKAEPALKKLWASDNERHRARALWLLGKIEGKSPTYVDLALKDKNADIRIVGIRLARELGLDTAPVVRTVLKDENPAVRRDAAIALRDCKSPDAAELWADLACQHDGKDRWYLEALGIGANKQWDAYLGAYLKKVGDKWNTPEGRDVIWRSRAKVTPEYLVKIIKDKSIPAAEQPRYMRAFDFQSNPEKDAALKQLLDLP